MLTKKQQTTAFLQGMGSIYNLYPPFEERESDPAYKPLPLPEISIDKAWADTGKYLREAFDIYEKETFRHS
jgi:hypothetical protein